MKYINLLPPELQAEVTAGRQESRISSKAVIGCLAIPGVMFVVFFGVMKLVEYRYNQRLEQNANHNIPPPAVSRPQIQAVTSKMTVQPPPLSKKEPPAEEKPPPPERERASTVVVSELHSAESSGTGEKKNGYTLVLGSFPTEEKAKALMQKMREQKLEPYQSVKQVIKNVNTVYVDQSSTMEEAMILTRQLEADGFEAFIKIRPQGTYWVGVKSSPYRAKAQELAERLSDLGYSAKVVAEKQPLTIYKVYLGHYEKYREAKLMQNELEEQGYHSTLIVKEQERR
jgi:cell division protein FtsN